MELFGCRYTDGRAQKAPKMRSGAGTSKGEMLMMQEEYAHSLMDWQNRRFPADTSLGEMTLPDAYHCVAGLLPHLHDDLEERFPQVEAAPELPDQDPPMDDSLEARGTVSGQAQARFRRGPSEPA